MILVGVGTNEVDSWVLLGSPGPLFNDDTGVGVPGTIVADVGLVGDKIPANAIAVSKDIGGTVSGIAATGL